MKARLYRRFAFVFSVLFFLSTACSLPIAAMQQPTEGVQTASVSTVEAMMTQIAGSSTTATAPAIVTATAPAPTHAAPDTPTSAPLPTSSPLPAATALPSATARPTATQVILPTATYKPICDMAGFVADISIADGSVLTAGTEFTKTWRLKNLGSCTWTPDYALVFDSGSAMNGPASQRLNATVVPGATIDVSVYLKAPGQPGSYRGNWQLRNAAGAWFGLGADAERFYVDIKVVSAPTSGSGYDFAANACLAQWTGNNKTLPCVGVDGSADGFVLYQPRPILESGYQDDEAGLITNPPLVTDGVIRGKYPAYTVANRDHFLSIIGCDHNAKRCNVRFQLDYQIDNGSIKTLGAWNEAFEGLTTTVDVDLSSLAGKNVSFILTVLANGTSDNDRALWLLPRIANQPLPTATPTVTLTPTVTVTPTVTPTVTETIAAYP